MILLALLCLVVPIASHADSIVDETFEAFSTGNVNGQGNWTSTRYTGQYTDIDDTVFHTGGQSLHYNGFSSSITYTNPDTTPVNERTISFYWRPSNLATNDTGANGAMRVYVRLKRDSPLYYEGFYLNFCHAGTGHRKLKMTISVIGNGGCTGDLMGDMTANNWYFIEAQYNLTTRKVKGRVDGGSWSPELTLPAAYTNFYVEKFQIQNMWSSTEHFHFDNFGGIAQQQLTVARYPEEGGGVISYPAGDGIYCGVDGYSVCQFLFDQYSSVDLEAYPNDGWSFAYWDDGTSQITDNPYVFTMDGARTVTARFLRVFRCAAGDFRYNVDDHGGQCVEYVRSETDVEIYGNASTWYQTAVESDYRTGYDPAESAVIVFGEQTGMPYGHVGIVVSVDGYNVTIRDSNWCMDNCETIKQHTIDVRDYYILGYIYCSP